MQAPCWRGRLNTGRCMQTGGEGWRMICAMFYARSADVQRGTKPGPIVTAEGARAGRCRLVQISIIHVIASVAGFFCF